MPELSRAQVAVYGAIAVALLLVGARAIRGEGGTDSSFAAGAPSAAASTSGAFTISGQGGDLIVDVTGAVARPDAAVSPTSSPTTPRDRGTARRFPGREARLCAAQPCGDRCAEASGAVPVRVAQGGEVRSGRLGLEVLWPPADRLVEPLAGEDPNLQALVILARWRDFTMLLTADAEAESAPIDPGPLDVLKVAHHGSDDGGLGALLNRSHRSSRSSPWGSRTRTVTRPRAPCGPSPLTVSAPCAPTATGTS
jgi:hypothetical protein